MPTKKEEFHQLHCPRCTEVLTGIGLAGTTMFTCSACGSGWTISDLDCPDVEEAEET
jgi:transposase-like protein